MNKQDTKDLEQRIIDVLHTVYDPEIPVDIYELGLIYDIIISDDDNNVKILMTLTSPNCPMIESLPEEIKSKVASIADVNEVDLELTFDPPWDKDMMSDEAKLQLGFL